VGSLVTAVAGLTTGFQQLMAARSNMPPPPPPAALPAAAPAPKPRPALSAGMIEPENFYMDRHGWTAAARRGTTGGPRCCGHFHLKHYTADRCAVLHGLEVTKAYSCKYLRLKGDFAFDDVPRQAN
jgi:hypothetical protein